MSRRQLWPSSRRRRPEQPPLHPRREAAARLQIRCSIVRGERGGGRRQPGYAISVRAERHTTSRAALGYGGRERDGGSGHKAAPTTAPGGRDQRPAPGPADAAGAADGDLVAPGAVDARAVPGPLRRHVQAPDRLRRDLGDGLRSRSWSSRSSPATRSVFHAGEGNQILRPILGDNSVLVLDEKPHISQRQLLLPPFHGERMQGYGETMARDRRPRDRELADRHALQAAAADAGDHAGDHPRDRLRRPRRRADGPAARRPCATSSTSPPIRASCCRWS